MICSSESSLQYCEILEYVIIYEAIKSIKLTTRCSSLFEKQYCEINTIIMVIYERYIFIMVF